MADKIVILEDENGNNIYPITRGLAANSVDTNAIQDGAVTSSKIDWTTLGDTLWTNPNPTQTFPAQTVSFSGSNYQYFVIEFSRLAGNATRQYSCKLYCPDSTSGNLASMNAFLASSASYTAVRHRMFSITNSSCDFSGGTETVINSGGSVNITQNDTYYIPTRILGYKG